MEKIVRAEYLKLGAFVSRLDRPWLGTPFALEGLLITSERELEALRRYSTYVYIDTSRGSDVWGSVDASQHDALLKAGVVKAALAPRDAQDYQVAVEQELSTAQYALESAEVFISSAMDDARLGGSIDTDAAKRTVARLIESIMRNPDALLLLTQLKDKDHYTTQHSFNVCVLALAFGRHLELTKEELTTLGAGALLHDIGKTKIPGEILNKPGPLTETEFELMKGHVIQGVEILHGANDIPIDAVEIVYNHHERHDGSGYPRGLAGLRACGEITFTFHRYAFHRKWRYTILSNPIRHRNVNVIS